MANRERGEQALVVGGTEYILRLTTNACAELEDFAGGLTWDQLQIGIRRGSIKSVRLLLWAALRDRHPTLATTKPDCLSAIGILIDESGGVNGKGLDSLLGELRRFVALNEERVPDDEDAPRGEQGKGRAPDPPAAQAGVLDGAGSSSTPASSA